MNKLPDDLINMITDYLLPIEFFNYKKTSNEYYRSCNNKKHLFLYYYFHFDKFFYVEDKTKILTIQFWSNIIQHKLLTRWLNYIVYTTDYKTNQLIYNIVWNTIISSYYINKFCPTRYNHKTIVTHILNFKNIIFEQKYK